MKPVTREGNLKIQSILTVKEKGSTKTIGGKTRPCGYTVGFILENVSDEIVTLKSRKVNPGEKVTVSLLDLDSLSASDTHVFDQIVNGMLMKANGRRTTLKLFPKQSAEILNICYMLPSGHWKLYKDWVNNKRIVDTIQKYHKDIKISEDGDE